MKNLADSAELQAAIERVHRAGMPGVVAEVRDGDGIWRGAAGVADVGTGRPITADMRHRVGSISKTFTAAAILQQVEGGRIGLDTPIGRYLPRLVPGERGDAITVRMLLNHTSGLADYLPYAFPSLKAFPYSVYDMSWVGPAASLVTAVADLNRFFGLLLGGAIVDRSSLAEMQRTVPVISFEGKRIDYGLGLHRVERPGCGTFWGHDGTVWGAGAISMTRADGKRQMSVAVNLQRWNRLDSAGKPEPHPIDDALAALYQRGMCG